MSSKTYIEQYEILKNAGQQLSEMAEPDIDALIPLVQKGTEAFQFCKDRIDTVRKQLAAMES